MVNTTLVVAVDESGEKVLLGRKKLGFGTGKIVSFGGKIELGEKPLDCIQREFQEETSIYLPKTNFKPIGFIEFHFPYHDGWGFKTYVFHVIGLNGQQPRDSGEISSQWYSLNDLPWAEMWEDGQHWLLLAARGKCFKAEFTYGKDGESLTEYHMTLLEKFDA